MIRTLLRRSMAKPFIDEAIPNAKLISLTINNRKVQVQGRGIFFFFFFYTKSTFLLSFFLLPFFRLRKAGQFCMHARQPGLMFPRYATILCLALWVIAVFALSKAKMANLCLHALQKRSREWRSGPTRQRLSTA